MVHCFRGMGMAVRADGYYWVMEQLGEKQDFESELSRRGYLHENFALNVRRARSDSLGDEWTANYFVCVTELRTSRSNVYLGGPRGNWVEQFSADLALGVFGPPQIVRKATHAPIRSAET